MVNKREDQAFSDPATFVVIKNSLYAAAEEMKVVLAKTAYSPILKVAGDYSCGIFDISGQMVAQGPDLPIHLGSMPDAVKAVVSAFETFEEGDVFIHNDPYFGGSHLPDVNVVSPAFYNDKLIGFACIRAHWPDVGSASPGSYGAVTEIYGEGLRLPPLPPARPMCSTACVFSGSRVGSTRHGIAACGDPAGAARRPLRWSTMASARRLSSPATALSAMARCALCEDRARWRSSSMA